MKIPKLTPSVTLPAKIEKKHFPPSTQQAARLPVHDVYTLCKLQLLRKPGGDTRKKIPVSRAHELVTRAHEIYLVRTS